MTLNQPTDTALLALAVAALGPVLGPYVVILIGSVWGGVIALTTAQTGNRVDGLKFMLRAVLTGMGLTTTAAWAAAHMLPTSWGATPEILLFAVAVLIGWSTDKLGPVRDRLLGLIAPQKGRKR